MLQPLLNKRTPPRPPPQDRLDHHQLATHPNLLLPIQNSFVQNLPPSSPLAALNLSPIISAVSAPSGLPLTQPTLSLTMPSTTTTLPTPTSTPSPLNTLSPDHSATSTSPSCSASTQCPSITSPTDTATLTPTSLPNSSIPTPANDFLASLGSSAGSIFVTTLVGLAILGVIFAISSWGLRRWCNRRRRKIIDEDTWSFLNTPKEFANRPLDDDLASVNSFGLGFSGQRPHVLLHHDNNPSPVPFPTHLQHPHNLISQIGDQTSTPAFLPLVGFHPSQPPTLNCFMDEGHRSWMNNSNRNGMQSSMYGGVLLAPIAPSTADHLSAPTAPEAAYGTPRPELSQLHGACVGLAEGNLIPSNLTAAARSRSSAFVPPVDTDHHTPLTALPAALSGPTRRHPLARDLSVARSDVSSTVEILRARVQDQKIDIRSKLFGAIRSEALEEASWSPSDVLSAVPFSDSTKTPYVPVGRLQPATPRPLQVVKRHSSSVIRYQLADSPPVLNRESSQASCYSVTTTVI